MTDFKQIQDVMNKESIGKKVAIRGWVYRQRTGKDIVFIVVRDSSSIIQCAIKGKEYEKAKDLPMESSVKVIGTMKEDSRALGGYEIQVTDLEIVGKAERFPITEDQSTEFLRDVRHLWIRSRKITAILKVRSKVFEAIHEHYRKKQFYETHPPIITSIACECGGDQMSLDYFGKTAYLTQSWQLYAEAMIASLEKIYTIIPAFRSEKSKTSRHLIEYWTAEMEAAWYNLDDGIKDAEELISHICQKVADECKEELKILERNPEDLKKIKPPFPRITYTEALDILKKDKMDVPWGKDLRTLEERQLSTHFDKPIVVTNYPTEIMAFYKLRDPKNPKVTLNFDIICPEIGVEIVGGSQRSEDLDDIKERLAKAGEPVENYEWYFDTRRYGSVPHTGFGLGIERVIYWICKLEHIQDAIPFPRLPDRLKP